MHSNDPDNPAGAFSRRRPATDADLAQKNLDLAQRRIRDLQREIDGLRKLLVTKQEIIDELRGRDA